MPEQEFFIETKKRSLGRIFILIAALIVVVLLTVGAYFYTQINQASSSESVPSNFVLSKGMNTRSIASQLVEQKIINSYWSFVLYAKYTGAQNKFQAGTYALDRNMTVAQIVDVLTLGKVVSNSRKVTIIEGKTNAQIATQLEKQNIVAADDFLAALKENSYNFAYKDIAAKYNYQGFLFPDTYEFAKDATAENLVARMLSNFESKLSPQMKFDMAAKNLKLGDVITLASIIEKEVGRNKTNITADDIAAMQKERGLVASVFYNRLAIGMPLESDATVNYITGKSDRSVSIEDTKINSPYNTYVNKGLPPTPISNPGLDSIMAAIYPTDSEYLYFLNAPDGTAYFAKTLAEHNANKAKYLK